MTDLALQARSRQIALRAFMLRALIGLWPGLNVDRLDATFPTWALSVGQLVVAQHAASVRLSTEYLRAARFATIGGAATIVPAAPLAAERLASALQVTSVVAVKRSMTAGKSPAKAMDDAFVQSSGAATRLALDGGRDTILESVKADPRAEGWRRVTGGRSCDFCASLAGETFAREDSADFQSHDHCACSAAVVYR